MFVNDGAIFRFDRTEKPGSSERVFLPHPQIFEAVEPGHMLLLDDGKMRMRVIEKKNNSASPPRCWSAARCRAARASACPTRCCRSVR